MADKVVVSGEIDQKHHVMTLDRCRLRNVALQAAKQNVLVHPVPSEAANPLSQKDLAVSAN
jgi:hypothetical protein